MTRLGRSVDDAETVHPETIRGPLRALEDTLESEVHALRASVTTVAPLHKTRIRTRAPLPTRNLASFLADLPDECSLASLLLPGTHDTLAFYGWPLTQCQSTSFTLEKQLRRGIRVLDVRLAVINSVLIAYHGTISQKVAFTAVLETIRSFLTSEEGRSECIVMSIKQEDFRKTPEKIFSTLVKEAVYTHPELWFLSDRIPQLGEVRGKIILFSRFSNSEAGWPNGDNGLGIHPTTWPDSRKAGFEWDCDGTTVRTQDWYEIPSFLSIPEKFLLATEVLVHQDANVASVPVPPPEMQPIPIPNSEKSPRSSPPLIHSTHSTHHPSPLSESSSEALRRPDRLTITYLSASSFPLALPPMIALGFGLGLPVFDGIPWWIRRAFGWAGINERMQDWLIWMLGISSERESVNDKDTVRDLSREKRAKRAKHEQSASTDVDEKGDGGSEVDLSSLEKGYALEYTYGRISARSGVRLRGWVFIDFADEPRDLLPLLVECNFV